MSYVSINALTVADDAVDELVRRFADRPHRADGADGFERFELLRPADGRPTWLVVTHWRDRAAYDAWAAGRTPRTETVSAHHEVWFYETEQDTGA